MAKILYGHNQDEGKFTKINIDIIFLRTSVEIVYWLMKCWKRMKAYESDDF